jgi:predicted dehydrogenase
MYNDLDIGILGYGGQGKKIFKIIFKKYKKKIFVYSSKTTLKSKEFYHTNIIEDLNKCKIIFICTPNHTHFKYLNYFKKTANYIFCEKPPCNNINEYRRLKNFSKKYKKKIYFNFNYIFSEHYNILKKKYLKKKIGKLIDISISAGNGISFKTKLLKNWRSNSKNIFNGIIGNLGIHYLNLLRDFLGNIKINQIEFKKIGKFKIPDTVLISVTNNKKISGRVLLTYASPFHQNIKAIFANSIIEVDNERIVEHYPRETFDKNHQYIKPKQEIIYNKKSSSIWSHTLSKSVDFFLKSISQKKKFSFRKFDSNLEDVNMMLKKLEEKN